jgi:hypothetical protein
MLKEVLTVSRYCWEMISYCLDTYIVYDACIALSSLEITGEYLMRSQPYGRLASHYLA